MKHVSTDRSVRELRAYLAEVLNDASVRGDITYVTSRGRRIAAVVPVETAAASETDSQADADALTAGMYASSVLLSADHNGIPGRTMREVFDEFAADVLKELGGDVERVLSAARAVVRDAIGSVAYPALWRQASFTVELCQRAAELAGAELAGSYRPGATMSTKRR